MSDTTAAATPPPEPDAAPVGAPPALPPVLGLSFTPTPVAGSGRPKSFAIIGKSKAGKTRLGGSSSEIRGMVAAGKKTLILENEAGTASIANEFPRAEQFAFTNHLGFMRAINELLTVKHDYGTIVLDTFDKFQEYAETYYLSLYPSDTRKAYGELKKWTLQIADALHKAPFFVIFLFHSTDNRDEKTGVVTTTFKLVGSAGDTIGQTFDLIAHLTVEDGPDGLPQRVLQLGPKTNHVSGNRWESVLPNKMVNATIPLIFDIIDGTIPAPEVPVSITQPTPAPITITTQK